MRKQTCGIMAAQPLLPIAVSRSGAASLWLAAHSSYFSACAQSGNDIRGTDRLVQDTRFR